MAVLEDVEVHVVSSRTKKDLVEYENPDPKAAAEEREVKKYVEAESDEEFYFSVKLKAGFKYHGADGVNIHFTIDGNAVNACWHVPSDVRSVCRGKLGKDVCHELRVLPAKRGNDWVDVAFAFGKAEPDEDLPLEPEDMQRQLSQIGTIVVWIERGKSKALKHPRAYSPVGMRPVGQIDKKLVLQKVSNTFKTGKECKRSTPKPITTEWKGLTGKYGEQLRFVFRYRSHRALQSIGCIPTTPPPVLLDQRPLAELSKLQNVDETSRLQVENEEQRKKIQELTRATYALAEEAYEARIINAKISVMQSTLASLVSVTKQEFQTPILKRERSEECGTVAQVAKKSKPGHIILDY